MWHSCAVLRFGIVLLLAGVVGYGVVVAQTPSGGHEQHHPAAPPAEPTPPVSAPAGMGNMMQEMGEMMRSMGAAPPKEFYPSLMDLPDLPPEKRTEVQRAAYERMQSGTTLMLEGLDQLLRAASIDDSTAMQDAIAKLREGLARFDSGMAAHRALAEGRDARQLALQWFKTQMHLPAPPAPAERPGPWGLSWSHLLVMALLAIFAVVMITMYFFKVRRAADLLQRLTNAPAPAAPAAEAATPPAASIPAPPAPTDAPSTPVPVEPVEILYVVPRGPWSGSLHIARIFTETPTIKTFRLVDPAGGPIPFGFLPGQFLTLTITQDGQTVKRTYTIASSPTQRDYVELTIKREDLGGISRHLHDRVREGDLLQVAAPQGTFTFTGVEADSIVLIGGGVGLTPLMSVIRYLTDRGWPRDIYLFYCCRTTEDFVFREELERLQRRHPTLHVVATMTRAHGTTWMGPTGRLTEELLAQTVPDLPSRRIHLCGPPAMMDAMRANLLDLGVPRDRIKTEAFGPAEKPLQRQAAVQAAMAKAHPVTTPTVTFTLSGKAAPLPPGTTVLEAAEHIGVPIDSSCRVGTCGTCKVTLRKGSVTMAVEDALDPEEKASGIILACQARATGNIEVEA
jgi:ferredoxin-NADP reductase